MHAAAAALALLLAPAVSPGGTSASAPTPPPTVAPTTTQPAARGAAAPGREADGQRNQDRQADDDRDNERWPTWAYCALATLGTPCAIAVIPVLIPVWAGLWVFKLCAKVSGKRVLSIPGEQSGAIMAAILYCLPCVPLLVVGLLFNFVHDEWMGVPEGERGERYPAYPPEEERELMAY